MDSVYMVARKYFYDGNYEQVIEKFPALMEYAHMVGADVAETRLRGTLGAAFAQLNDTDRAEDLYLGALEEAKKRKDTFEILSSYINLGNTYFLSDGDRAIKYLNEGFEYIGEYELGDRAFVIMQNILASIYVLKEEPEMAQKHVDLAMSKLGITSTDARRDENLSNSYQSQGSIYLLQGLNYKSIESTLKSLELGKNITEETYLINNYKTLIEAYDKTNQYEKLNQVRKPYDSLRDRRYEKEKIKQEQIARFKFNVEKYQQELRESQLENLLVVQKADQDRMIIIGFAIVGIILIGLLGSLLFARNKRNKLLRILRQKNSQYLRAKETSEKLSRKNTKFLSTISHELRTPLYGIIGLSSVFLKNPKLKDFSDDFNSLKFSADYLLALINDVLNLNKYESKKGRELQPEHFDLRSLVNSILQTFQFLNEKNNNKVALHIDPDVPKVLHGDKTKLSQVLMNLLSNASKFTVDGNIDFSINQHNNNGKLVELFFCIKDTGSGIKEEHQNEIFEEFIQVPNNISDGGTGLGLPIVNKLLKILGCQLLLESAYGVGTTFSFLLPMQLGSQKNLQTKDVEADVDRLINKKLLIVDDNKINQLVTQKVLEQYGMTHDTVNNGQEAVDIVKHKTYDFILMDINMPVMNGLEASMIIREMGIETPILALTAAHDLNLKKEVHGQRINDILVKPYHNEQLLNMLVSYLDD
ncbi:response regulator [Nonlabens antarcticus]|uniref:response regulator n=1 Tax=Nonlabens antarcticus TaxID=392714 RepID=UPI001891CD6E|nr:response regulator [Nonlabens antarcticus]